MSSSINSFGMFSYILSLGCVTPSVICCGEDFYEHHPEFWVCLSSVGQTLDVLAFSISWTLEEIFSYCFPR